MVRGWGRHLALACAGASILHRLFEAIYQFALVNPAMKRAPMNFAGLFSGLATAGTVVVSLIVIAYNIALLIVMLHSGTTRVFRRDYKGEEDQEDERPRRRRPPRDEYEEDGEEDEDDLPPRRSPRRVRRAEEIRDVPPRRRPSRTPPPDEDDE